ncbi:MAG: permease [Alphaproteobacteria bacterium RIFCSPHIGHO2_12_FULL_63_12]|nr:MAG: permease [Alphaproteobacteria bacterium RIFCSPHIGHO2_12_FULL_63_12]
MRILSALVVGVLFGLGLTISGMINPAKIIAFLDVAGNWDPSLLVVMVSALAVSFVGYRVILAREKPLYEPSFHLPTKTAIDQPLLVGSAIFGAGWGLSGLCPGPAISATMLFAPPVYAFLAAMVAGMLLHDFSGRRT